MLLKTRRKFRANSLDALTPELWSETALFLAEEQMVAAKLVHRDFENRLSRFGDVVNAHRPQNFSAIRKAKTSDITIQDAGADTVPVKLNQQVHVAFAIDDRDLSLSFVDLIPLYLKPAATAMARRADITVMGMAHRFRGNMAGDLNTSLGVTGLTTAREKLEMNSVPDERFALITPPQETALLQLEQFTSAEKVGDTAGLRQASLGQLYGLDIYGCRNAPSVGSTYQPAQTTGAINNGGGYAAGTTTLVVDGFTGDKAPAGSFVTIAGDYRPRRVASSSLTTGNTTGIVLGTALGSAVADNAVITVWGTAAINNASGYASGYEEKLAYDGAGSGKAPQVGQMVAFGSASAEYTVVKVNDNGDGTGTFETDRPLEAALSDNAVINLGPTGSYGLAGHRNAMALVVRPMATPKAGVLSHAAIDDRIGGAVRATIQYDIVSQKTIVVLDMLLGITVLDTSLATMILSNNQASS